MRGNSGLRADQRSSALWGKKSGRSLVAAFTLAIAFVVPVTTASAGSSGNSTALVPASLLKQAQANPSQVFHVIVQGNRGDSSADVAKEVGSENGKLKKRFLSISGVAADVTGKDLVKLARHPHVLAITPDLKAKTTAYESNEVWRESTGVASLWGSASSGPAPQAPAIAFIDSGIDASKASDFGGRVVAAVDVTGSGLGDQNGHGTMVAGIAAGASPLYPGVAQNAPIVSVKAADAGGQLFTSDIIAGADWVLQHKSEYNIGVVNMSLRTASPTTFRYDPLDKAVERLWFSGVVVVAAAGNFGTGSATTMAFAPGNDPFVITVGALDTHGTASPSDDDAPSWSAYGRTPDGFNKPELGAPGRYIVGPVPALAALPTQGADRVLAPGYMWMSGTSLAAPVVSGSAAQILARHPGWTPDQVKGALMSTATPLGPAAGYGEVDAAAAAGLSSAPAANEALERYVSNGSFDATAWTTDATSGVFQTDWLQTDWLQTDWLQTDWLQTDWLQTDWLQTDWLQTDWLQTDWLQTDWVE